MSNKTKFIFLIAAVAVSCSPEKWNVDLPSSFEVLDEKTVHRFREKERYRIVRLKSVAQEKELISLMNFKVQDHYETEFGTRPEGVKAIIYIFDDTKPSASHANT